MFTVYLTCLQVLTILSRYYVNIALPFGGVPINKRAHTVTHMFCFIFENPDGWFSIDCHHAVHRY